MSPHELLSLKCQYEEVRFLPLSGSNMTSLLSSLVLDGLKKKNLRLFVVLSGIF